MSKKINTITWKDKKNPGSFFDGTKYKVLNGTDYHIETSYHIVRLLEEIRLNKWPCRFHWGDANTGEDWGEVNDVTGRLGRSMGPIKVPILLENLSSDGGSAILAHCIVKIVYESENGAVLYQHPNYRKKRKSV